MATYEMAGTTRTLEGGEKLVIFASSLGTVFEWYDFYLYGSLAPNIAKHFFSGVNPGAAFIFTLLAFAAGFFVRKLPALRNIIRPIYVMKGILPQETASGIQSSEEVVPVAK